MMVRACQTGDNLSSSSGQLQTIRHTLLKISIAPVAVLEILRQRCPIWLPIANAIEEEQMLWACAAIRGDELDALHGLAELLAHTAVAHRSKLLEINDNHDIRRMWLLS